MSRNAFFESLFGKELLTNEWIELIVAEPPPSGVGNRGPGKTFFARSVEQFLSLIDEKDNGNRHIWFGVGLRKKPTGRKEDVSRLNALFVDSDDDKHEGNHAKAYTAIQQLILPPSIIVDTGYGYHGYWLLESSISPVVAERALQALRKQTQGDSVCEANRCLRVPGTYNVKRGGRVPCRIVRERYDLVYKVRDLLAAAEVSDKIRKGILSASTQGYPSRSERDWGAVTALGRLGMSKEAIKIVFHEQPVGDKVREDGDRYLNRTIDKAFESIVRVDGGGISAQFLFIENHDRYFLRGRDEKPVMVSTFTIDPLRLYKDSEGGPDAFVVNIQASGQTWKNVVLPKKAFHNAAELRRALTSVYWQWTGSDNQVALLLPYLVSRWEAKGYPMAEMTSTVGRHGDVWVWPEGAISLEGELDSLASPVVYVPTGREAPHVTYDLTVPEEEYRELIKFVGERITRINEPECIWPILGWFFATPFKPLLDTRYIRFPSLNIYGSRGSGKTATLNKLMLPLFGHAEGGHSHDCSTTHFVLMALMSGSNAVPIYLTEFRRSTLSDRDFRSLKRVLLQAYDVGWDSRGRADQTTVKYKLSAPIIIDGEDALRDPAILQRTVVVLLDPITILEDTEAYRIFTELSAESKELYKFAGRYIQHTLRWTAVEAEADWLKSFDEVHEAMPKGLPDRVIRNLSVAWFGIQRCVEYFDRWGVQLPQPEVSVLTPSLEGVVNIAAGRTSMHLDEFVTDMIVEVALQRVTAPFNYKYIKKDNILWIHLSSAYKWWERDLRSRGLAPISKAAIKQELKQSDSELKDSPAQYIILPKAHNIVGKTEWMHGIMLDRCLAAGLDIPPAMDFNSITVRVPTGGAI